MDNKQLTEYKTKDLGEAAALLCKGVKLLRLDSESNFYWFVFSDGVNCQELSNKYWFGELLVNAKSFQEAQRTLKDRLFSRK